MHGQEFLQRSLLNLRNLFEVVYVLGNLWHLTYGNMCNIHIGTKNVNIDMYTFILEYIMG